MCKAYYRIIPYVQKYSWGKKGEESLVGVLANENYLNNVKSKNYRTDDSSFCSSLLTKIEDENYSELWMGNHPNGRNFVILKEGEKVVFEEMGMFLEKHQKAFFSMNSKSNEGEKQKIDFLLKVLSVRTPLSIQTHPNKSVARNLRKIYPDIFKDDNHKPEMAVAISDVFYLFCGLRSAEEICAFLLQVGELRSFVGNDFLDKHHKLISRYAAKVHKEEGENIIQQQDAEELEEKEHVEESFYKDLINTILSQEKEKAEELLLQLVNRVQRNNNSYYAHKSASLKEIVLKYQNSNNVEDPKKNTKDTCRSKVTFAEEIAAYLHSHFPGDVGVFFSFLLNFIQLNKGEAIFIDSNILHSYLSGECIECMANSDNVLRCGLTEKEKHKELLLQNILYVHKEISKISSKAFFDEKNRRYNDFAAKFKSQSVIDEFEVIKLELTPQNNTQICFSRDYLSICIVIEANECTYIKDEAEEKESIKKGDVFLLKPNSNLHFFNSYDINKHEQAKDQNLLIYAASTATKPH